MYRSAIRRIVFTFRSVVGSPSAFSSCRPVIAGRAWRCFESHQKSRPRTWKRSSGEEMRERRSTPAASSSFERNPTR